MIPATTPQVVSACEGCRTELAAGTLACPNCSTLVYGRHLEQISRSATNLEETGGAGQMAEARELWLSALPWVPRASRQAEWIREHATALDQRLRAAEVPEPKKSEWAKRLGPLAPILVVLAKLKGALLLIFKLKFLLSFAGFLALYWAMYGMWFGGGFAFSILIHEIGHVVAVRRQGLEAEMPVFVPGFGAFVRWRGVATSAETRAGIALAGPMAGFVAAVGFYLAYLSTHRDVFAALAHTGAWLNLMNLIPVWILDGGQAMPALSRLQRGLLLATCVVFFAMTHEPVLLLVALGMGYRLFTKDAPEESDTRTMVAFTGVLFVLSALLAMTPAVPIGR